MSPDERFPYSRRAIVGAGSIGLVAAAAPAFAQSSKERPLLKQDEASAPEALQDPRTKHPKPPFRRQEQPWPVAGPREPDGSALGSRRDVLSRLGSAPRTLTRQ
jgi:hypothetical protein